MSVAEIIEQVKTLNFGERKEVLKAVIDLLDAPQTPVAENPSEHWGQNLLESLDEMGPIEFPHPEIEDVVELVKIMRQEARQRRLGDWGTDVDEEDNAE